MCLHLVAVAVAELEGLQYLIDMDSLQALKAEQVALVAHQEEVLVQQ
jgi:hypothetical protein